MSTFHVATPKASHLLDLTRVFAFFASVIEVFAEARAQARAAHERFPFVE
jgi:hypothetical protein